MIKELVLSAVLAVSQSPLVLWEFDGFETNGQTYVAIQANVGTNQDILPLTGMFITEDNRGIPATGSCFSTSDGWYCGMNSFNLSAIISLDNEGDGTIFFVNEERDVLYQTNIYFSGAK